MANNPYVNKVQFGNQTVMDISDTTATPENVLQGQTFYLRSGQQATGTAIGGIPEEELRDTVGWTGKNLLQIPNSVVSETKNGITFTVYRDNSGEVERININGTASADTYKSLSDLTDLEHGDYTLSKGSNNADAILRVEAYNNSTYVKSWGDMSSESKTIDDVDYDGYNIVRVLIKILSGKTFSNVSIYPMLRKSSVTDADYEPYHDSVAEEIEQIYSANGVLGAKNLLAYPIGTRQVINSSGVISDDPNEYLSDFIDIEGIKSLTFNAAAVTGTVYVRFAFYNSSKTFISRPSSQIGNSNIVETVPSGAKYVRICFEDGNIESVLCQCTNPMLRLASDTDSTYQPYAMTNRELTEKLPFELIRLSVTESAGNSVRFPAGSETDSRITTNSTVIPVGKVAISYSAVNVYNGYVTVTLAEGISGKDIGIAVINQ